MVQILSFIWLYVFLERYALVVTSEHIYNYVVDISLSVIRNP